MGLPRFVRVLHPGPPPVPHVGVNGTPSLTVRIIPSCQPSVTHFAGPANDLDDGTSQVPFTTSVRPTLKSEGARFNFMSKKWRLEMEFPNASPATVAELVSMLLPQV